VLLKVTVPNTGRICSALHHQPMNCCDSIQASDICHTWRIM